MLIPVGTWVVSLENEFLRVKLRLMLLFKPPTVIGPTLFVVFAAVVVLLASEGKTELLMERVGFAGQMVSSAGDVTTTVSVYVLDDIVTLSRSEASDALECVDDNLWVPEAVCGCLFVLPSGLELIQMVRVVVVVKLSSGSEGAAETGKSPESQLEEAREQILVAEIGSLA